MKKNMLLDERFFPLFLNTPSVFYVYRQGMERGKGWKEETQSRSLREKLADENYTAKWGFYCTRRFSFPRSNQNDVKIFLNYSAK